MPKMFKMDPVTNGLDTSNRGFSFVAGTEYRRQKLLIRLGFFLAEWFLDITKGFDYYGIVFIKNPDFILIEATLKQYILETDGIESFISYNSSFDSTDRVLSITFKVLDIDNNIIDISEFSPL